MALLLLQTQQSRRLEELDAKPAIEKELAKKRQVSEILELVPEAPAPEGPWRRAVKILTHDRYSFYNPKQHPYWAREGGRVIYLEGTYTASFSGNPRHTPRYDYNQLLYRLDLGGIRLKPAHNGSR